MTAASTSDARKRRAEATRAVSAETGLREALTALATEWGNGIWQGEAGNFSADLLAVLAAHPAPAAVCERCTCDPGPEGQHQTDRCDL